MAEQLNSQSNAQSKYNADTVLYTLYILYRANILTRNNLKEMFKCIKEDKVADVAKFLAEEVAKAY